MKTLYPSELRKPCKNTQKKMCLLEQTMVFKQFNHSLKLQPKYQEMGYSIIKEEETGNSNKALIRSITFKKYITRAIAGPQGL